MTTSHFDDVVQTTRNIAATAWSTNSDNSPSLALKLGYNNNHCAGVLWGKSIRSMEDEKVRKVEYFQKLYSTYWKLKVSSQAQTTMWRTERNREEQLPICEDLLTCREYLLRKIKEEEGNLKSNPSAQAWTTLAELILARIISFNKRPISAGKLCEMHFLPYYDKMLPMCVKWCQPTGQEAERAAVCLFVCWSLTSLCHSNGHIETMPAREINPFTALTRIRSQFLRTQWSTSNHSEWTRLRIRPLSHRLREQHSEEWLHRTAAYLTACEPFASSHLVSTTFKSPPALPDLPRPEWLLTVFISDVCLRLDEVKAKITSTYGSILKMDSTKKVAICAIFSHLNNN